MSLTPEEEGQRLTMEVTQPPLRTGSLVQTHRPPRSPSEASGVTAAAGAEPCTVPTARRTQKDPNAFMRVGQDPEQSWRGGHRLRRRSSPVGLPWACVRGGRALA